MLDKLTSAILDIVNAGTEGSYKVMESADILAQLPSKKRTDEQGLSNILRFLNERGYIDIKYSEKGTYCLCSLPKGRTYAENVAAETAQKKAKGKFFLLFAAAFVGAFVGAFAAYMISFFFFA